MTSSAQPANTTPANATPANATPTQTAAVTDGIPKQRLSWKLLLLIAIAVVVAVLLAGGLLIYTRGYVVGVEFSPYSFQSRTFDYREIPYWGRQIGPVEREELNNPLQRLVASTYLPPNPAGVERWDLVEDNRTPPRSQALSARILVDYLEARQPESPDYVWLAWSTEHPDLAAELWPRVVRLARLNQYSMLPDLFRMAWKAKTPQGLESKIAAYTLPRLIERGEEALRAGKAETAREFADFALDFDSEDGNLQEFREQAEELLTQAAAGGSE